jgi:hypothetical protein
MDAWSTLAMKRKKAGKKVAQLHERSLVLRQEMLHQREKARDHGVFGHVETEIPEDMHAGLDLVLVELLSGVGEDGKLLVIPREQMERSVVVHGTGVEHAPYVVEPGRFSRMHHQLPAAAATRR